MLIHNLLQLSSCISQGPSGNSSFQMVLMKILKCRFCLQRGEQRFGTTGDSEVPQLATVWNSNWSWAEGGRKGKSMVCCGAPGRSCTYEGRSNCQARPLKQGGVGKSLPHLSLLALQCPASTSHCGHPT